MKEETAIKIYWVVTFGVMIFCVFVLQSVFLALSLGLGLIVFSPELNLFKWRFSKVENNDLPT